MLFNLLVVFCSDSINTNIDKHRPVKNRTTTAALELLSLIPKDELSATITGIPNPAIKEKPPNM